MTLASTPSGIDASGLPSAPIAAAPAKGRNRTPLTVASIPPRPLLGSNVIDAFPTRPSETDSAEEPWSKRANHKQEKLATRMKGGFMSWGQQENTR